MKIKKLKSKHKWVLAVINNRMEMFPVLHEEMWIPTDSDGDFAEEHRYIVSGSKRGPKIYLPIGTVLFERRKS